MKKTLIGAIAIALVALTVAYRLLTMGGSLGGFENDQFVTLSQAQQVVMGEWPMRDFVELGMPLTILLSAAGQVLFGHTLFAEALLTSGLIGLCTAILFVLAWRASGSITIALLVALIQVAMAPRFYNYPKLLAYAVAIPALWWYLDRPDRKRLVLLAVAGVFAFLLRHDHGLYVAAASIIAVALAHRTDVRHIAREVAVLGATALVVVLPYLVFLQIYGGTVSYVESFVRYANQTEERTAYRATPMTFDASLPLVMRVPVMAPRPRINVRWASGVSEDVRAERERALGLGKPEPLGGDVTNYEVDDISTATLAAIVRDPAVADTSGIDRQRFVINDPFYTHVPTRLERAIAFVRSIRILPGLLHAQNAVPFLYVVMYAFPIVALLLALARGARATTIPSMEAGNQIVVVAVLALLIDRGFLRGSLPSRLADVSEVVGVVAAWVAAVCLARLPKTVRPAGALVLTVVLLLTALSVEAIENVSGQIAQTRVMTPAFRAHVSSVHMLLTATPAVDAWPADAPGMEGLAHYVNRCTAPDDRVLALGYLPELFFMSARRFAAGHVWIQPRFFDTESDERLMIDRLERGRVPIVITVPDPEFTTEYVASFPALTTRLRAEYEEMSTMDFGRGFRFRILARRNLPPTGTYEPGRLPCFS